MTPAQILCIGVNHETAPLSVREGLACSPDYHERILKEQFPQIAEWVWISTCNRVELYAACFCDMALDEVSDLFNALHGSRLEDIQPYVYTLYNEEAARHLLDVAAGLDSLVLGEPQILGQVNRAFHDAQDQGTVGHVLRALFRSALTSGKRVRNETAIGQNPASVPSVAINQAREVLGGLGDRDILLVGAGAMAQTAIKALRARNYSRISIANRTPAHAWPLVEPWNGCTHTLDELPQALETADVVFSATHAAQPLLTGEMLAAVQEKRGMRPILLIDLAVPRDIDTSVRSVPGVTLIDIDHLQSELDESLIARRREVPAAEAILEEELERLRVKLAELSMRPVIVGLRQKAEIIRRRELERTMRHLGDVDQETLQQIHHLSRSLVNQLLHEPTTRLREEATGERPDAVSEVVRDLFNLKLNGECSE
jgi:glutamyl-tRNA reductase